MRRPVALLDVDHTLLFDKELNEALLISLLNQGIKDVYLFTDMRFGRLTVKDRMSLVKILTEKGFNVHGVLTPSDVVWQHISAEDAAHFDNWLATKKYLGKFSGPAFESLIQDVEILETCSFLEKICIYDPYNNAPGASYQEAVSTYLSMPENSLEDDPLPNNLLIRSTFAKAFADYLAEKLGYVHLDRPTKGHTKGLMLDFFLRLKPEWVSSIIVADDNPDVIDAINEYPSDLLITSIKVPSNKLTSNDYESILIEHFQRDKLCDFNRILDKIDQHISALNKSKYFLFFGNGNIKIQALELLKIELKSALIGDISRNVSDIISNWNQFSSIMDENSHEKLPVSSIISYHRNLFFSEPKTKLTNTEHFINDLTNDVQNMSFN